jgi:hypothetical protein
MADWFSGSGTMDSFLALNNLLVTMGNSPDSIA